MMNYENNNNNINNNQAWKLNISVDEIDAQYQIIVKPSTVISAVICNLISNINLKYNWSTFSLYDATNKQWLLPVYTNISNFDINSSSDIKFIQRFRVINIQLPDLQIRPMQLDLSKKVYETTKIICQKLSIRNHEELSLQFRLFEYKAEQSNNNNKSAKWKKQKRITTNSPIELSPVPKIRNTGSSVSQQSINKLDFSLKRRTSKRLMLHESLRRTTPRSSTPNAKFSSGYFFRTMSIQDNNKKSRSIIDSPSLFRQTHSGLMNSVNQSINDECYFESFETVKLANSPLKSYNQAVADGDIFLIKNHWEKCKFQYRWLNAQSHLNEIVENKPDTVLLMLRYRYHNYKRLDERFDAVRINQLFQQTKWDIISGQTICKEEEVYVFGGLILHLNAKENGEQQYEFSSKESLNKEIDTLLDKLSLELLGRYDTTDNREDMDEENSKVIVNGFVKLIKYPRKFYNKYQKRWAEMRKDGIELYKLNRKDFVEKVPLWGSDVTFSVKWAKKEMFILDIYLVKNNFKEINSNKPEISNKKRKKPIDRIRFRFSDIENYLKWTTVIKLSSRGIDYSKLIDYQLEYNVLSNIIKMKRPQLSDKRQNSLSSVGEIDKTLTLSKKADLNDIIGPTFNKRLRYKQIMNKLLMFKSSFDGYTDVQAKVAFIKCWLTLKNAGVRYYAVMLFGCTEACSVGIGYERLELTDLNGKLWQMWKLSSIMSWNTNWETNKIVVEFKNESIQLEFFTDEECAEFHEYIGGYLFIMMRNMEKGSNTDNQLFMKLTSLDR